MRAIYNQQLLMKPIIFLLLISLTSCFRSRDAQMKLVEGSASQHKVEVNEVIQSTKYTYLKVSEDQIQKWLAVAKQEVKVGETYYFDKALQMNNFYSKELDKTFDVIYFINEINSKIEPGTIIARPEAHSGKIQSSQKEIKIVKTEGELTIADLFKNRLKYAGTKVRIKGLVGKVNKAVMGKNWIHLQDGTNFSGNFDLTITSQDMANTDEIATFEGLISLNKNFGSGYFYELIMEDAIKIDTK
ncbi:MAG: hypothetical protein CVU00_12340 [Bacteroidetes bacterium HGW-Bacteroidetes-17]|nr:MAG: hypothetical protein CVU00_12340 [Bacteroidetes bacterium HGW-Bacteroidetes-17]